MSEAIIQIILISILSIFFMLASSIKIFGWQAMVFEKQLAMFISYGLNRKIMLLTGLIELTGSITIWFFESWVGAFGAFLLLGTSLGAIMCHLIFDTWKDGIPAMITAAMSGYILWFEREAVLILAIDLNILTI